MVPCDLTVLVEYQVSGYSFRIANNHYWDLFIGRCLLR